MGPENENVNQEVVNPENVNQEVVNPEEAQETQEAGTPTQEQGETQESQEQRVPYERFKEKVDEANWYKQQLEQASQKPQSQPQQRQTQDPYAGMDPATEKFYRDLDARTKKSVQEAMKDTVNPQINAGLQEIAAMKTAQFRKDHSDIKAGSLEESQIGNKIRQGYSTDDAYWSVMGPRGIQPAVSKAKKQEQQKFQQKRQANVETSPGIPNSSLPANQQSERDLIGEALDDSPLMK